MIAAALLICLAPMPSDGDTMRGGLSPTTIRLFGVNAPETGAAVAAEARAALAGEVAGGVQCEPKGTSYSRIVALCRNSQGVDVGGALLKAGHAKEVCSFSRNFYGTCP